MVSSLPLYLSYSQVQWFSTFFYLRYSSLVKEQFYNTTYYNLKGTIINVRVDDIPSAQGCRWTPVGNHCINAITELYLEEHIKMFLKLKNKMLFFLTLHFGAKDNFWLIFDKLFEILYQLESFVYRNRFHSRVLKVYVRNQ